MYERLRRLRARWLLLLVLAFGNLHGCGGGTTQSSPPGAGTIAASPSSIDFGSVSRGSTGSASLGLSNIGDSSATISGLTLSNSTFTLSGASVPLTLASGATSKLTVGFSPSATGSYTGTLTVSGSASNLPAIIDLRGSSPVHTVALAWQASPSSVAGYRVYRANNSGGPYTLLNSSLVGVTSYEDASVSAGQTLYYVVTAVDSSGVESDNSNEASATVPSP